MLACDYLARVGFDALLANNGGGPTPLSPHDEDDTQAAADARRAAALRDHAFVRSLLTAERAETYPNGQTRWSVGHLKKITWDMRVPGLACWSGQQTLAKIVRKHQDLISGREDAEGKRREGPLGTDSAPECPDLFAFTAFAKGGSGIDPAACPDAIDVGFSLNALGMEVRQRPAVELLAIVGLECVPLLASFAPRECGFVHGGKLWRFALEAREGGYYFRWGELSEYTIG